MYSKKKHILVVLQRQTSVTWHITRTYKDINKINYNINILHFVKTQIPLLVFDFLFFKDYFCRVYSLGESGKTATGMRQNVTYTFSPTEMLSKKWNIFYEDNLFGMTYKKCRYYIQYQHRHPYHQHKYQLYHYYHLPPIIIIIITTPSHYHHRHNHHHPIIIITITTIPLSSS